MGVMRINTKLATLVHARDNESNESITDMTEGLPFFPLLCPRVSGSGNYLPCVIIIRGVKSRHTRVSRPSRGRCRPRFFHLRPVHSLGRCTHTHTHTHTRIHTCTHTARYELVVRQSIAYVPCSPNFRRCCREWNWPGMYPLAVKISAHLLWTVRKIPFPAGRANGGRGSNVSWKISRGLCASDRFRI